MPEDVPHNAFRNVPPFPLLNQPNVQGLWPVPPQQQTAEPRYIFPEYNTLENNSCDHGLGTYDPSSLPIDQTLPMGQPTSQYHDTDSHLRPGNSFALPQSGASGSHTHPGGLSVPNLYPGSSSAPLPSGSSVPDPYPIGWAAPPLTDGAASAELAAMQPFAEFAESSQGHAPDGTSSNYIDASFDWSSPLSQISDVQSDAVLDSGYTSETHRGKADAETQNSSRTMAPLPRRRWPHSVTRVKDYSGCSVYPSPAPLLLSLPYPPPPPPPPSQSLPSPSPPPVPLQPSEKALGKRRAVEDEPKVRLSHYYPVGVTDTFSIASQVQKALSHSNPCE